jgi:hypothetical protein
MRRLSAAAAVIALLALTACSDGEPPGPPGPEQRALQLFEPSLREEPVAAEVALLFGAELDGAARAALFDALAALPDSPVIEAVASEEMEVLDRMVVDIKAGLPAGGSAKYSVQLEQTDGGGWRILWFQGPGVEWPGQGRTRGDGLTTSAPPTGNGSP